MGIFSSEKISDLYWMGRYADRTQDTLKLFMERFDRMLDADAGCYRSLCTALGVPDVYRDRDDFIRRYPFDKTLSFSIISSAVCALNNGIVMREYLGSDTLSYLQMVVYDLEEAALHAASPIPILQRAADHTMAFWGCLDDEVADESTRNIVKLGKRFERLDIDLRLMQPAPVLQKDFMRLKNRLNKSILTGNGPAEEELAALLGKETPNCGSALTLLHQIITL